LGCVELSADVKSAETHLVTDGNVQALR
jgi:hypothetical protein